MENKRYKSENSFVLLDINITDWLTEDFKLK